MFLCQDILFVQNQVNRPEFTRAELAAAIKETELRRAAAESLKARPNLSPVELIVMTRAVRKNSRLGRLIRNKPNR